MARTLHASRRVVTSKNTPFQDSIWISDALLAESFHRFTCAQSRHGSHVPGPMEARRRANKRKNTSLAQFAASPPVDPNVLFGSGPHTAWWQISSPIEQKPAMKPQLRNAWWQPSNPAAIQPVVDNGLDLLLSRPVLPANALPMFQPSSILLHDHEQSRRIQQHFTEKLQHADSLDRIRDIIRRFNIDVAQNPMYSELAFEHILATKYELASSFLLDSLLNPSTARNYGKIIKSLEEPIPFKTDALQGEVERWRHRTDNLLQTIIEGFRMGLVPREDASIIIRQLPDVKIPLYQGDVNPTGKLMRLGGISKIRKYYGAIFEALSGCDVFGIRDLGQEVLNMWITQIYQNRLDSHSARLILKMERAIAAFEVPECFAADAEAYELFIDITSTMNLMTKWIDRLSQQSSLSVSYSSQLVAFMCQLPLATLRPVVIELPIRLVIFTRNGMLKGDVLRVWEKILCQVNDQMVLKLFADESVWRGDLKLKCPELPPQQRLLVSFWTTLTLFKRTFTAGFINTKIISRRSEFLSQLREYVVGRDSEQFREQLLLGLRDLPLPSKGRLIRAINHALQQHEHAEHRAARTRIGLEVLKDRTFAALQHDVLYKDANIHMNEALQQISQSVNYDLPTFAKIIVPLVAQDKLSIRVVTRLLQHSQELKISLSQSWTSQSWKYDLQRREVDPPTPSQSVSMANMNNLTELITQENDPTFRVRIVEFMHELAITFALSRAISNRQALRKVFWCFRFLHRYGAPIHKPMTMALWYAGVTRCERESTSRRIVQWLLRKVEETEGSKAAELLVTSKDFRLKRTRQMLHWGCKLGIVHSRRSGSNIDHNRGNDEKGNGREPDSTDLVLHTRTRPSYRRHLKYTPQIRKYLSFGFEPGEEAQDTPRKVDPGSEASDMA